MKAFTITGMQKNSKTTRVSTNWLMSPYAGYFFHNHNWSLESKSVSIFAEISDPTNPVAYVSQVRHVTMFGVNLNGDIRKV